MNKGRSQDWNARNLVCVVRPSTRRRPSCHSMDIVGGCADGLSGQSAHEMFFGSVHCHHALYQHYYTLYETPVLAWFLSGTAEFPAEPKHSNPPLDIDQLGGQVVKTSALESTGLNPALSTRCLLRREMVKPNIE